VKDGPALRAPARGNGPAVHLLPNFDECLVAYKDRTVIGSLERPPRTARFGSFPHHLLLDGQASGAWRRTISSRTIEVDVLPYRALTNAEAKSLEREVQRLSAFLERPATVDILRGER
jgi:Winged helix DNA-binding domain